MERRVSREKLSRFFRCLAVMVGSGITLAESLEHLARDESLIFSETVTELHRDVVRGASFSFALQKQSQVFPPVCSGLIRAAEETGRLHRTLDRLARYLSRSSHLERRFLAAMLYPVIILVLTLLMVLVTVQFIFPRERELLESLGAEMPAFTETLFLVLGILFNPFTLAAAALLGYAAFIYYTGGREGKPHLRWRRLVDVYLLRLPVVGDLAFKMAASRTLSIFSNLLEAGSTVDKAMLFSAPLMGNVELEGRMLRARNALLNGSLFSEALEGNEVFPVLAIHLFKVAEESGGMAEISHRLASIFEREVEDALDTASTLVEPLALLFVGGFVGVILLATLLPTVSVMGQL